VKGIHYDTLLVYCLKIVRYLKLIKKGSSEMIKSMNKADKSISENVNNIFIGEILRKQ